MRVSADHEVSDEAVVRRLVAENPFATIVSAGPGGLVASHYPVLVEDGPGLSLVTHLGRPDERLHDFRAAEVLVIVSGPHGYVSPGWYSPGTARIPTWNFAVAHLSGTPRLLDPAENVDVLNRLVDTFERLLPDPVRLDPEDARKVAPGTVGLRIPVAHWRCKVKMSADKDAESRANVLAQLRGDGPYASPALADEMERALAGGAR